MTQFPRNQSGRQHFYGLSGSLILIGVFGLLGSGVIAQEFIERGLLGGDNTVLDTTDEAFTNPLPLLSEAELERFEEGDELFEQIFVPATGADEDADAIDDGLGPIFNVASCEGCHVEDGRGRPPEFDGERDTGFLIRTALSERSLNGRTLPDPIYGGQFQEVAIDGTAPEGDIRIEYTEIEGEFADGTAYSLRQPTYIIENLNYGEMHEDVTFSPRVANQMIGLGLLEAIPEATIEGLADPNDRDGDGISGRPNYVWDGFNNQMALGRFGWKASEPGLTQQTAGAYNQDMGVTTSLNPHTSCMESQTDCLNALYGDAPEVSDEHLRLVTFYVTTLAVPAQRDANNPMVKHGADVFEAAGCSSCHVAELETGIHPTIAALSKQTIQPYTDLLLHDMGDGLADGQLDAEATGTEWRTPPLWGIGLFETVNGHTNYLHDGRARNLMEAILWHGGEAEASRDHVIELSAEDRDALIEFLESL
jgi:CxxC motif-containing protein (DUF1111 family)